MAEQLMLDRGPAPLPAMVTCFSLDQPYAGLVAAGLKDETRLYPWPEKARPYPSPLLICSTVMRVHVHGSTVHRVNEWMRAEGTRFCELPLSCGVALAVVDIVGCRELVEADLLRSWYWDPAGDRGKPGYLWTTTHVRRVRPFRVKGMQGFAQKVPRDVVELAMREYVK